MTKRKLVHEIDGALKARFPGVDFSEGGLDRTQSVVRACEIHLRPVLTTCFAACVGLLPAALSASIGAQAQKPLALVVVGGTLLVPALILLVLPVLIDLFSRRRELSEARELRPMPGE